MAGATFGYSGARENDIRGQFDLTPTAFYQHINQLLDWEEALAWNAVLVNMLRARNGVVVMLGRIIIWAVSCALSDARQH